MLITKAYLSKVISWTGLNLFRVDFMRSAVLQVKIIYCFYAVYFVENCKKLLAHKKVIRN